MLIISLDAVGDDEFDRLMEYPAFSAFSRQAAVYRDIPTVFVSNTYPIHASVVTGVVPSIHGLTSNTERFPKKHPVWNDRESLIDVKTLWQAAKERGIETAAVFWPVTAYSKTVRYNIPEVLSRPGKNQVVTSLKAGSTLLQLRLFLRYRKLLSGISQPARDNFATACMAEILRKYKPGLALMHLTAYDSICHGHGKGSEALLPAIESLVKNLAILLKAAGSDEDVVILTDHSQINVHTSLEPNNILVSEGLLVRNSDKYIPCESNCFIECCGGSAFFHAGMLPDNRIDGIRGVIERSDGFRRFLSDEELRGCGYGDIAFGFCAQPGYSYVAFKPGHKAEHGYPPDTPDYRVFYMAKGFGLPPGGTEQEGSLLDIAPLIAKRLGLELPQLK